MEADRAGGGGGKDRSDIESWHWYGLAVIGAVLIALVILFREFIFSDRMLFSGDILLYGVFHRSLIADFLSGRGPFPLWDPYVSCGLPFVDAIHGAAFHIPAWLDYLGYLPRMTGFTMLVHFVAAAGFSFLAARRLDLSRGAAAVTAVAYGFSPCLLTLVAPGHEGKVYAASLFPLALYFTERLLTDGRRRDIAALALTAGMLVLTPHLQMAYYTFGALAVYTGVRLILQHRMGLSSRAAFLSGGRFSAAIVLALAISAIQLIPSARYLLNYSARSDQEKGVEYAASYSMHAEETVALVFPEFCGYDRLFDRYSYWGKNNVKDNSESVGILIALLATIGVALSRDRMRWFWLALATGVLVYSLGTATPLFTLAASLLPFLDKMRAPGTSMFLFAFALAILAGMAVDAVRGLAQDDHHRRKRRSMIVWSFAGLAAVYAVLMLLTPESALRGFAHLFSKQVLEDTAGAPSRWPRVLATLPEIRQGAIIAVVLVATALFLLLQRRMRTNQAILPVVFSVMILISYGWHVSRFVRTVDPHPLFENNPIAQVYAQTDPMARTDLIGGNPIAFQLGYHRIPSATIRHGKDLRWYLELAGPASTPGEMNSRFINLTGTRYFICAANVIIDPYQLGPVPLDTLLAIPGNFLLQNRNATARAFLVSEYRVIADRSAPVDEVLHGKSDLRRTALLESDPALHLAPDSSAQASISYYGLDSVEVEVLTRTDQLLILTDNHYDAWHALVDSSEMPIYRVNGSFRAVAVPAGSHRVIFRYSSPELRCGAGISLLGLVFATALFVPFRFRKQAAVGSSAP